MSEIVERIQQLKKQNRATVLAHTYQPGAVQDVADFVGDSYGLSVQAVEVDAQIIVFAGVMFMAETAAILNPSKTVIIPQPDAGCPMADMITPEELQELKAQHPGSVVMCYVNSTAEIKALSDICCTSSNALKIARQIPLDKTILFVPDRHLGSWVQEQTGHTMVLWDGCCPTHVGIRAPMLVKARKEHPDAPILIHPEAPRESRDLADEVLSTGGMCEFVARDNHREYVIATETGIIHTLKRQNPDKIFHALSDHAVCPNMKKGTVEGILAALEGRGGQVVWVPEEVAVKARLSLERMLTMSR